MWNATANENEEEKKHNMQTDCIDETNVEQDTLKWILVRMQTPEVSTF